jgi:hypothetical protein
VTIDEKLFVHLLVINAFCIIQQCYATILSQWSIKPFNGTGFNSHSTSALWCQEVLTAGVVMAVFRLVCSCEETRFRGCKVSNPGSATIHSLTASRQTHTKYVRVDFAMVLLGIQASAHPEFFTGGRGGWFRG